jgi:hypothetical protein
MQPAMKSNQIAALAAIACAMGALASPLAFSQSATSPSIPVGTLTASPTLVLTGTKPTLRWNITYPASVVAYISISPTGTITPNQNLIADVRVLGAGVTTQNSNGSINYIRTMGQIRYNGASSWSPIFDGKNTDTIVQQQGIIKTFSVTANQPMNFAGNYYYNNTWSTLYSSLSGEHVRTLVNGNTPPSNIPDYNAPSLESFIKPYLDASGKVRIGPMDVIIFMELTHTNKADIGYDVQDLVLLITFRTP